MVILTILATVHCLVTPSVAQQDAPATRTLLAFPGAEGYGRFARGGRGGDVYHVNNCDHLMFDHVSVSWGIDA